MALALILEDGTGLAGANTYASIAEANAYHDAHLYASVWTAASDDQKAIALAMATRAINANVIWKGFRRGGEQALEWPRNGVPRPEINTFGSVGSGQRIGSFWPDTSVPKPVKDATAEMARILLASDRTAEDDAKGIAELGLGNGAIQIKFNPEDRKNTLPGEVSRILAPLARSRGSRIMRKVGRA